MRSILAILLAGISLALPQGATGSANQLPSTFTWYVEDRFGSHLQAFYGPDGRPLAQVPVVTPLQEYIHSPGRTVQFDACAADQDQAATYGWRIDNGPRVTAGCRYEHAFSTPGPHEVDLTITGVSGRSTSSTQTIDLRDYLIVSLGDSYASGEGNPEVPGTYAIAFPPCRQEGKVQRDDVRWLHQNVLRPLNATERRVAHALGWIYVDGIADPFHGHGYCAADHWFVTYPESWAQQGDDRGTLHPNRQGHRLIAGRISEVVRATLSRAP